MNFIRKQYVSLATFFKKRLAFTFWICLGSFIAIAAAVAIGLRSDAETVKTLTEQMMKLFQSKNILNKNGLSFINLLLNNLWACFMPILSGCIPFLFLPAVYLAINAGVIGIVGAMVEVQGRSLVTLLVGILPHGIFEIPAMLLGMACGIQICKTLVKKIIRKAKPDEFREVFFGALRTYFLLIVPLLLVAALIETYVTPALLKMVV